MSLRLAMSRALTAIYKKGADVKYHHAGGVVSPIKAFDSNSVDYSADGFMATVQENQTVYYVMRSDIPSPSSGDFIVDGDLRFNVVNYEPSKSRLEWMLITREEI